MRLFQDYMQLRKAFPHAGEGEAILVTMADIAELLYCTQRNAKLILNKMIDHGWITFVSGRGRGHASALTFLVGNEELLLQEAKALAEAGEVESAFRLLKENAESGYVKERFVEWFSRYFGYRTEAGEHSAQEVLKLPLYRTINTIDPADVFFSFDGHLIKQVFSTLVETDEEGGEVKPNIAHHWKRNAEATEWTFYLRKGIQFHHGRELTAEDVQYSLCRLQKPESQQRWLVKEIASIEVLSRYAIRIRLNRPNYLFLLYLSFPPASIVPQDLYEKPEHLHALPVGCGPFRIVERKAGRCALEAFDAYFLGRPYVDRVEIIVVPEIDAAYRMETESNLLVVKTGEADIGSLADWQEGRELCGCSMMSVNLRKDGVLRDIRLRKAIFHLINREQMIRELGEQRLYPASQFRFQEKYEQVAPAWQEAAGRAWLQEAAYDGEPILLYTFARHEPDARWLKSFLEPYGINLEVHIVAWSDLLREDIKEQADLLLFEAVLSEGIIRLVEYYQSANSLIFTQLSESLALFVDEKIQRLLAEPSAAGREAQLASIEHKLDETCSLIYLTYKAVNAVSHPSLQGVKVNQRGWVDFKDVWFDPAP
ncbi:SgrR family transcriptional regulator [Brevibacillus migulae]|uniref:SgrR family transcriptional regulator n=1 Tax=Brevibacillus migulae TaxID=1644114 RepID=UPI00106E673D|nr:SgrR family transcriptional regulator [Brevibacillus migulae]